MAHRKWLHKRYLLTGLVIFTTVFILSRWSSTPADSITTFRHGRVEVSPDRYGHGLKGPSSGDSPGAGTSQRKNIHILKDTIHPSDERNQNLPRQVDEANLRLIQAESVPRRIAGNESNVSEQHHQKQAVARTQPEDDVKANKTAVRVPPKKRKLVLKRKILRKVIRRSTGEVLSSKVIFQDVEKGEEKTYDETWYKDILAGHFKAKVVQVSNKTRDDVYMTEKLWKFDDPNSERLFLYNKLLNHDWKRNITNLRHLRRELREGGVNAHEYLAVTQESAPLNSTLLFYPNTSQYYTVTEKFRKNLPAVSPFREKRYRKCAVIGNSGSLLNSSCGRDIDSAEMVFRCNAAPIKPFVNDAGSKSNITTFNPSIFRKRFNDLLTRKDYLKFHQDITQYNGYLWLACFGGFSMHEICLSTMLSEELRNSNEPEIIVGHPDHYRSFWAFWERRKMIKTPSTGFFMTHVALQLCDETHLYGFWPFSVRLDTSFERVPYHYFDHVLVSPKHAMNQEFSIFSQYHELGIVRLHTGKCQP